MLETKIYNSVLLISPELVLIVGALLILLFGVYNKSTKVEYVCHLSMAIIFISIYQIFNIKIGSYTAFNGSIIVNVYTKFCKAITLIVGFFIAWLLSDVSKSDNKLRYEILVLLLISLTGMCLLISSNNLIV